MKRGVCLPSDAVSTSRAAPVLSSSTPKSGPKAQLCPGLFPAAGTRTCLVSRARWLRESCSGSLLSYPWLILRSDRLNVREGFSQLYCLMFSKMEVARVVADTRGSFTTEGEANGNCQSKNCRLTLDQDRCPKTRRKT